MMNYLVTVFSENYQGKEVYEQVVYNVDTPELAIECLKAMMIAMGDEDGHHRTMLLIEKYVDNNVKESLIKEIILFQGD